MFLLVTYDIPDDRRRLKVMWTLEGFGSRVQKSVFECNLTGQQYQKLKEKVLKEVNREEDSVRYYSLCQVCQGKVEIQGTGEVMKDPPFYVV